MRSISAVLRHLARWALLIALALGPVGLGAALDSVSPAACSDSCDCDAVHAGHANPANANDDDCGGECPPDCPDCDCCPGFAPVLHPALRADSSSSRARPAPRLAADAPAPGDSPDFFRPPRRLA